MLFHTSNKFHIIYCYA